MKANCATYYSQLKIYSQKWHAEAYFDMAPSVRNPHRQIIMHAVNYVPTTADVTDHVSENATAVEESGLNEQFAKFDLQAHDDVN